jgi:hypothetical protein
VAQAVKPAEPRFISAFFFSLGDSSLSATANESWINCGADFHGSLPHALYPPPNKQNAGQAFVWMDRYLDSASGGPLYLKQQSIAQLVVDSIPSAGAARVSPSRFFQTLNGWQAESYDRSVRDNRESNRTEGYIENNPVKAGLVANAEDYPWSSALRKAEMNLGSAGLTACATIK